MDTDDCLDDFGGTCEPYQHTPGIPAWECEPRHVREFWWPMDHCPNPDNCHNPDHPGDSLDCATT